jgi:hypothetical protein
MLCLMSMESSYLEHGVSDRTRRPEQIGMSDILEYAALCRELLIV